ncbi:MAG: hypothetical protein K0U86_21725 [Planctomycetes bacterium]|nr:hypothetical protein [Planctomycetota bacterium]MCH9727527.1 hypothetical protein [Planctomycetota bacterium]MCH9777491.1 hypothetical protein [Planctomycetota bacterium]
MNLVSEMMVDDGIVIYTAGLDRWDPPDDKVPISDKEQSRIQKNISEDFMRDQIPVTWV